MKIVWVLILLLLFGPVFASESFRGLEMKRFAEELAKESDYNAAEVMEVLNSAEYRKIVIDRIRRPAEKTLSWREYQDIFLDEKRRDGGVFFMKNNREDLSKAEKNFGVPPEVVTAIIGIETRYGRITGNHPVLDTIATLSFFYEPRSYFFREELKELFLMVREENLPIKELKGSYAGAMGMAQFIPSSFRKYAIDYDKDGFRDIWHGYTDVIGSVANYLYEHGWKKNDEIAVQVSPACFSEVSSKDKHGVNPGVLSHCFRNSGSVYKTMDQIMLPMKLIGKEKVEYWLGFWNFSVITKYNRSNLYAMAVYHLSRSFEADDPD